MQKISFTTLAILMLGVSCGGPAGEPSGDPAKDPAGGSSTTADEELATHPGNTGMVAKTVKLVSDEEGVAKMMDPNLKNAWGLAFNPLGAAWVSAAETGVSPVYDANGNLKLTVTIPSPEGSNETAAPTGQVFNGQSDNFNGDAFIFVTEQGTIAGWQSGFDTMAQLRVDNSKQDAIYKGVAIVNSVKLDKGDKTRMRDVRLLATDFHNNKIDVFDNQYGRIKMHDDAFRDRDLPKGYAPFNVMTHESMVIVTYALQDKDAEDDVAGPGNGFVDVYDMNGRLLDRLISRGELNAPWGLAMTPQLKHEPSKLLVGNFGDGRINVYNVTLDGRKVDAKFAGSILDQKRRPISIDGLWAIAFGPGTGGFNSDDLYFTAGPEDEEHGLFGKLVFEKDRTDKK
jgi:uncharacterized protein (TIGR03118 family)